ncbi:MAG: hypothetical protein B6226_02150, partial [Candidatus Cloacimonetes bacterium 4572_65]
MNSVLFIINFHLCKKEVDFILSLYKYIKKQFKDYIMNISVGNNEIKNPFLKILIAIIAIIIVLA